MFQTGLNTAAHIIHKTAKEHGWWDGEPRELPEILMLAVSELAEALQEYRDMRAPHEIYHNGDKPEGVPIEIADCIIRLLDYCAYAKIDIENAIHTKHQYNITRPYRHGNKKC